MIEPEKPLSQVGERALGSSTCAQRIPRGEGVTVGVGDDTAVVETTLSNPLPASQQHQVFDEENRAYLLLRRDAEAQPAGQQAYPGQKSINVEGDLTLVTGGDPAGRFRLPQLGGMLTAA